MTAASTAASVLASQSVLPRLTSFNQTRKSLRENLLTKDLRPIMGVKGECEINRFCRFSSMTLSVSGPENDQSESTRVYVAGLPKDITEEELGGLL
jgi:hypothetical protein